MIAEIYVVDAQPTPRAKQHIAECVEKGVCLCGCGRKPTRRGLADPCYYAFNREMNSMPKKKAAQYEAGLIRRGLVLASWAIHRIKQCKSVLTRFADEINSGSQS